MNSYIKEVKVNERIEEIKEPVLDLSILKKRSSGKTSSGICLGYIKKLHTKVPNEYILVLQNLYREIKNLEVSEELKSKPFVEIEIVEGWKGIDSLEFFKGFNANFIIKSHQKDKETGEVTTQTHQITSYAINIALSLIKQQRVGEIIKYREFIPKVMKKYNLKISLNSFNGGKNRTKHYFPKYYYPIKILETLNIIKYSGRGDITRLK